MAFAALSLASSGLLITTSASLRTTPPRAVAAGASLRLSPSVRMSVAGESLRVCLLDAVSASDRHACYAAVSLDDLLVDSDLVSCPPRAAGRDASPAAAVR